MCVCVVSLCREYLCGMCVFVWSLCMGSVCVCVCLCGLSLGGESVCGDLYINVPYNLVKSLKCYTLNCLKDVIF